MVPAARADSAVFTVRGISVDATADNAAKARETAIGEGHVKAMQTLMERLVLNEDLTKVPALSADEIAPYVFDFSVANERTSGVRYLADLSFRFNPDEVRNLLRERGLRFAETRSKPVVTLPVYGGGLDARLWEDPNPWREVWAERRTEDNLVPLTVPLGDLGDVAAIGAEQALFGDQGPLAAIAERYGADDVLVTQAVLTGDPSAGRAFLQVITRRFGAQQQSVIDSYRQQDGEGLQQMLGRAAVTVVAKVQEAWKRSNLLRYGSEQTIAVTVPLRKLDDWLVVQRRLGGLAEVTSARLASLTRLAARVDLTYIGDAEQLALALSQRDLELVPGPSEDWLLRPSSGTGGGAAGSAAQPAAGSAPVPE